MVSFLSVGEAREMLVREEESLMLELTISLKFKEKTAIGMSTRQGVMVITKQSSHKVTAQSALIPYYLILSILCITIL